MDILPASSFDRNDEAAWSNWHLMHMVSHQQIYVAILDAGQKVDNYPLDDDRKNDRWKEVHGLMHNSINNVLSLNPTLPNLSDVQFESEVQFRNWMYEHAMVHQQINTSLGL